MFRSLFEVKISIGIPSKDKLSYYDSELDVIDGIITNNIDILHSILVAKLKKNSRVWREKKLQTNEMQEKYNFEKLKIFDAGNYRAKSWAKWYDVIMRFKCVFLRHYFDVSYQEMPKIIRNHIWVRLFLWLTNEKDKIPWKSILQVRESEFDEDFLYKVNEKILLPVAKKSKIVEGKKVRWDSTVIEEYITYPTEAKLLNKWVAMVTHMANKVKSFFGACIQKVVEQLEVTTRDMKLALLDTVKYMQKRTDESKLAYKKTYEKMIALAKTCTEKSLTLADTLEKELEKDIRKSISSNMKQKEIKISDRERKITTKYIVKIRSTCKKIDRVVNQTERRVINWESVPMLEKLLSYCSETVAIIQKWKEWKPIEFGRKLMITEAENRFIIQRNIPPGNPNDITLLESSFIEAVRILWKPPKEAWYDRWFRDKETVDRLTETYKTKFGIPKRWRKTPEEEVYQKEEWFIEIQKWRAWWEAEMNCLKRDCWLWNVLVRWDKSMKTYIWWWIITNNLMVIAKKTRTRNKHKKCSSWTS